MARQAVPEKRVDAYLLVEGRDDKHAVIHLCKHHSFPVWVETPEPDPGIEGLLVGLRLRLMEERLQTLGILVDADTDVASRWTSLRDRLTPEGFTVPTAPVPGGWISQDGPKRVGVWVMPDNHSPGILEDFLRELVAEGDELLPKADRIVDEIEAEGLQRYPLAHSSKARMHTWLAWQDPPGQPYGTAITARSLKPDTPRATEFMGWLRALFTP